jgi:hypothetical protein
MADIQAWDVAILVVAAYVALSALIRLMRQRREVMVSQLRAEVATQLERKRRVASLAASRMRRGSPPAQSPHKTAH